MSNSDNVLKGTTGKAEDFTDREKAVQHLQTLKESAAWLVKTKFVTQTDANMLRKVYGNINLKLNQNSFF